MTVHINQTYKDLDPRMEGRTLRVTAVNHASRKVTLETVSNASDVQELLDDETPGTRNYQPKDRRGSLTRIDMDRLVDPVHFALVEDQPEISGPQG